MTRIEALKLCHAYMRNPTDINGTAYHAFLKAVGGRDAYNSNPLPGLTHFATFHAHDPLVFQTWLMKYLEPFITEE